MTERLYAIFDWIEEAVIKLFTGWRILRQLNGRFRPSATTRHEIDRLNRISAIPLFFLHGNPPERVDAPEKRRLKERASGGPS